jgi:hypothetical protein
MVLVQPRFAAIDSSILASWAKDAFSSSLESQTRARSALKALLDNNWIPVLSWHHFEELIRHPDLQIAADRVAFLKSLPYVAWISSLVGPNQLGSIVDVFDAEIKALVTSADLDLPDLLASIRQDIIRCGAPSEIETFDRWRDFRPLLAAKAVREQEVASIVHAERTVDDRTEIVRLENATIMDRDSLQRLLRDQKSELARNLANRGDPRLIDPTRTAGDFTSTIAANFAEMSNRAIDPLDTFCKQFDVPKSDISRTTTLAEFKELARRRKLVSDAAQRLRFELNKIWPRLRNAKMPSEVIQAEIRRGRKTAVRASGSDLGDDYIACLAPYVDAIIVDKRTHEFLTQSTRRDPSFSRIVGFFARVASYDQLPMVLAA